MRVAMLGPYPQDEARIPGGPEAVVVTLLLHLAALPGVELHLLTCQPGLTAPYARQVRLPESPGGWTVYYLPRRRWGRFTFHLQERRLLAAKLGEIEPDLVHAQSSGLYAAAALDTRLPSVVTVHGISFREARIYQGWANRLRGALDAAFERRTLARAKDIISISPYVKAEFGSLARARVFDIENPVADVFFDPTPATNPHRILFAGRLIRRKGLHHLLPALQLARRDVPGVELVLAGEMESESDYVASLRAFAAEHSLPVHFLGPLSTPEMVEQYRACAFAVLPSKQETAPVVIEEAMAMGRAVIATRAGGVPAMIEHERTGLLVDYGDVGGLAASMTRLLREPGLAAQMGQQAHEQAVRRFRGDAVARQTYEAYGAVLQAARLAGRRK